jgi:predicted ATPase
VPALLVAAHSLPGATLLWRGQFTAARSHLEQGISFYSSEQRYPLGILHPGVVSFSYAGVALWSLGYPNQALARCYEGLTLAQEIAQPFSLAFAVQWTSWLHLQRGEIQHAQEQATRLTTLSMDWAFPFWETVGALLIGSLQVVQGHTEEGVLRLRQAITTHQATGVMMLYPASLVTLAEACGKGGKPEEGLKVLPEALTVMTTTGQHHWEAELYRIKGELTLQQSRVQGLESRVENSPKPKVQSLKSSKTRSQILNPSSQAEGEAEADFLKAIEVSRHQQAKSLELRATMSLARLWQQQGKKNEAHQVLAEIYGWFTEGFDTKDLQEAKALIDSLGSGV